MSEKHYPEEWRDKDGNKRMSCVCGNPDPFHVKYPRRSHYCCILVDNCMQSFTYLVRYVEIEGQEKPVVNEYSLIDRTICDTEFCRNVFNRPFDIKHIEFDRYLDNQPSFYGWHISNKDYLRVQRMAELIPYVDEFKKLTKMA